MSELPSEIDSVPKINDEALKSAEAEMSHIEDQTPTALSGPASWPKWKKNLQIWMVAFHSLMTTFMAAGIIPASATLADDYGVTISEISYLVSTQILLLGITPLVWSPIMSRYGRYHVCLLSVFGSMALSIGGVYCSSFGSQMATRAMSAFFISPPIGIGSGIITELCEPQERGQKLGWWTLMITVGIPAGPLIMGFVSQHLGVQWVFWIFAILNFLQFIAYLVFGAETLQSKEPFSSQAPQSAWGKWKIRRLDPAPFELVDVIRPLFLAQKLEVLIPGVAYAFTFCYANVAVVVEMPTVFGEKFNLNAQEIGLQFIALIIGCILGDQLSGPCSDSLLRFLRQRKQRSCPADRLWLSYVGYGTTIAGLLIWGIQVQHAIAWNITPCVGAAFAAFGNQVVTTTLVAFAVDSSEKRSTHVGLFINFCRQIYGFIGPFYFPPMFDGLGMGGAAGVMCALIAVSAFAPTVFIQIKSSRHHRGDSDV
ncbi:MFS multidrug transporter [Aspergillus pseudoustus]|uniref:MFS multidrug transporter n=1 Tax=Aspergillus pseudoustus TaxID=1810923 RepID=A0ABR4L2Z7_9EURO